MPNWNSVQTSLLKIGSLVHKLGFVATEVVGTLYNFDWLKRARNFNFYERSIGLSLQLLQFLFHDSDRWSTLAWYMKGHIGYFFSFPNMDYHSGICSTVLAQVFMESGIIKKNFLHANSFSAGNFGQESCKLEFEDGRIFGQEMKLTSI